MNETKSGDELNDGAGLAAYLLVLEIIGLLQGLGIAQGETVAMLLARARAAAETLNREREARAFPAAVELLESCEARAQQLIRKPN